MVEQTQRQKKTMTSLGDGMAESDIAQVAQDKTWAWTGEVEW